LPEINAHIGIFYEALALRMNIEPGNTNWRGRFSSVDPPH